MLTEKEYNELWETHFSQFENLVMPSYEEYVVREKLFEEYLKHIPCSGIKYILVAEAAPFNGAYFYNYNLPCGLLTPYFKQVAITFKVNHEVKLTSENAQKTLIELAQHGILLLDLFPFALIYTSSLRRKLIRRSVVREFWEGPKYSIKTQIQDLCSKHNITLHVEWDLCLIAPPIISNHIVENYDALDVKPCRNGNHNNDTFHAEHPSDLRNSDFKKVAVSSAGYPNATLIKIAFDL